MSTEQNRDLPQKGNYIAQFFRDKPIFWLRTIFRGKISLGKSPRWHCGLKQMDGWMDVYQLGVG